MHKTLKFLGPHFEDGAKIMLGIFLSLAVIIFVVHALMTIGFRYPLDYGEAPLVDQALRLGNWQNIYRRDLSTPPYTISNYPPLYMLLLAPLVKVWGPNFFGGRIISTLCTLLSAFFLGGTVYIHTQNRGAAKITGLLFLAIPYVVGWGSLLRVDMLALALSTAALYVISPAPHSRRHLTTTAILLIAAAYTKQSFGLAAPFAAGVWLWTHDKKQALILTAWVGGIGLALLAALNLLTGGGFFYNIITANVNPYQIETVQHFWRGLRDTTPLLLILGSAFLLLAPRRATAESRFTHIPAWSLAAPYLIGGLLSAATIGKVGSNINYLLELSAGLCLTTGLLVGWSASALNTATSADEKPSTLALIWPLLHAGLLILIALQVGWLMRSTLRTTVESTKWRLKPAKNLQYLAWLAETTEEPILADEFMGMLTLEKRPLYIQPFEITQLANAGMWDQSQLLTDIRAQKFPYIWIHHFMGASVYQSRWTPEMLAAIMEYYTPNDLIAETLIYVPRDNSQHTPADIELCPDAPWPLPTRGDLGMWWVSKQLNFMGYDPEPVPIYAVADGLLTRRAEWEDAVAIQHDDPLNPGSKVWTFYAGMAGGDGSYVADTFPLNSTHIPVKQGQYLGHQGRVWDDGGGGHAYIWVHGNFAVLPALAEGGFPAALIGRANAQDAPLPRAITDLGILNPSLYLGTVRSQVMGKPAWLPLECQNTTGEN